MDKYGERDKMEWGCEGWHTIIIIITTTTKRCGWSSERWGMICIEIEFEMEMK